MPQSEPDPDPFRRFRFRLQVDDVIVAGFSEATVPKVVDPLDNRDGDPGTRMLPSTSETQPTLTLKRGLTRGTVLGDWFRQNVDPGSGGPGTGGPDSRRYAALIVVDESGEYLARWNLSRAWPVGYCTADTLADDGSVMIETLDLVADTITLRPLTRG